MVKSTDDGKEELEVEIIKHPSVGLDIRSIGSDIQAGTKVLSKNSRLGMSILEYTLYTCD